MANEVEEKLIGRYKVFSQAGRDYASASFLAHDTTTQEVVRIKIYRPSYRHDTTFANHFRKDIPRARKPGNDSYMAVPTAWGYGMKIYPYVVFNHLGGKTFSDVVAVRDLSMGDMVELGLQATRALAAVHSAALVVGELTPQKLVITRKNGMDEVKVVEQGIGRPRILDPNIVSQEVDSVGVGTGRPSEYAAPEVNDPNHEPNERSDVYSLGAILWELFTGMRFRDAWVATPVGGKNGKENRAASPGLPTLKLPSKLPPSLATFLQHALQPDPARRFANANVMYEELSSVQSRERGLRARSSPLAIGDRLNPPSLPRKPPNPAGRGGFAAVVSLLLIALLGGAFVYAGGVGYVANLFPARPAEVASSPAASAQVVISDVPTFTATNTLLPPATAVAALSATVALTATANQPAASPTALSVAFSPTIASSPTVVSTPFAISYTLPYSPSGAPAQYAVDLTLDLGQPTIPVQQVLTYTNQQTVPLTALVFRVLPHRLSSAFNLASLSLDGQPSRYSWLNEVNLALPVNLPPGGRVVVRLSYILTPPAAGNYFAFDRVNRIISLGDWLPTVVPYTQDRPTVLPFNKVGDNGIGSPGDYVVRVRTLEPLLIAGSGQSVQHSDNLWTFIALASRDFALTASDQFADPERDDALRRKTADGTTIYGYFLPQHRTKGTAILALAAASYDWYSARIAKRGATRFSIAEMADSLVLTATDVATNTTYLADDKEFPDLYFLRAGAITAGNLSEASYLWWFALHGPAYQWFYADLATNQYSDPWLDEVPASYATLTYIANSFSDATFQKVWLTWGDYSAPLATDPNLRNPPSADNYKPVGAAVNAFAGRDDYFTYVYKQGATFCRQVRITMTFDAYWQAITAYHERNRGKVVSGATLLATWREFSKTDLNGLFQQFIGYQ